MPSFTGKVNIEYLNKTAEIFAPIKKQSYNAMALSPGKRVLDVGCGAGNDVIAMSNIVGPQGFVVGVDHDTEMLTQAMKTVKDLNNASPIYLQQCEAERLPFASNHFDACRSERLFMHLPTPEQALSEMYRVTKPGGKVVVIDTDWASLSIDCESSEVEQLFLNYRINHIFANAYAGRSLYRLFRHQHFINLETQVFPLFTHNLNLFYFLSAQAAIEHQALKDQSISNQQLTRWRDQLKRAAVQDSFYCSVNLVMVAGEKEAV